MSLLGLGVLAQPTAALFLLDPVILWGSLPASSSCVFLDVNPSVYSMAWALGSVQ